MYMEDYISSTNEATEEFMRTIAVLKGENSHLVQER
jgi:hypothetical protein